MSNHMFGNENYTSYVDADGHLVVVSESKKGNVEFCLETGVASYRRRQ